MSNLDPAYPSDFEEWRVGAADGFDDRPTRTDVAIAEDDSSTVPKCTGCEGGKSGYYHERCWRIRDESGPE